VSLVRRQPKEPLRLGIVLRDAVAVAVHVPEIDLRPCAALVRREPEAAHRLPAIRLRP
jgi:hypothetical protein